MAHQIRDVLTALGGEAHRNEVIDRVARAQGHAGPRIPEELKARVISAFEGVIADEALRQTFGFRLAFGAGSHRWSLKPRAGLAN